MMDTTTRNNLKNRVHYCPECARGGFWAREMSSDPRFRNPICKWCAARIKSGYVPCSECHGAPTGKLLYDHVRGTSQAQWCIRCDGYGRVYVGVPKYLQEPQDEHRC